MHEREVHTQTMKMPRSKSLNFGGRSGIYMGNPLKSILHIGNFKISSRSRGSSPRRFGDPGWIETNPKYSEFNGPSGNPARRIS
jgi:hypothetical protein